MRRFLFGLAILALAAPLSHAGDDQIAQQIVKSLKANQAQGNLKNFNIGLRVDGGEVFLNGHVANAEQERLALQAARAVVGVGRVVSEIEVRDAAQPQLAKHVDVVRPQSSKDVPPAELPTVHFANLQEAAKVRDAESLQDIKQAANESIASTETLSDAKTIAAEIIRRLRQEKSKGKLHGFGIDVEVDRGVVWLKGRVSSSSQQDLALEIARLVPGVKQVVNDLSVVASSPRAETSAAVASIVGPELSIPQDNSDEVARVVVHRLQEQKREGNLQDFGIDVRVEDGVVWMSGYVKNTGQQLLALDMARFVPGVKKVVNDLTVVSTAKQSSPSEPAELDEPVVLRTAATEPLPGQPAQTSEAPTQVINGQRYRLVPVQHLAAPSGQNQTPLAFAPARPVNHNSQIITQGAPAAMQMGAPGVGIAPARYDHPQMPGYAWPSYAPHPNYGAVTYPRQHSASAWPYIGPFYPYPQVPLGWRKVTLEWDDGWWHLDFKNRHH